MNFGKKLVSVAAGIALVAGAGIAAAAPSSAAAPAAKKTTYSGVTLISFDKALAPVAAGIVAVAPAKKDGTRLSFPVTNVVGNGIEHSGAIKIGAVEASNPVIINNDNGTGTVNVTVAGTVLPLFDIKNWKMRDSKKQGKVTTQRWQGFLHMTTNQVVVDAINAAVGQAVFTAGMGLGQIRTTIKATKG